MLIATDYPLLEVFWTMLIFFAFFIWIWILVTVFADLFRRKDLSGWGKTGWIIFVISLLMLYALHGLITVSLRKAGAKE